MRRRLTKSLEELVQENKKELLNDKQELEKIDKRIEKRHEIKKLA
ncbi:FbpB family small basic protein [Peribacillus glennii]|uniref:FbpB family small basic protein n=1 Tax=Peribacillus glennii TaxID=2303991 RepID=A0A372LBA1_9BACI|nr:FbpB family small basic protein [Peribacillus glennii]RFU62837.1 FbpB family small basic protein [Peribacillus glennii]